MIDSTFILFFFQGVVFQHQSSMLRRLINPQCLEVQVNLTSRSKRKALILLEILGTWRQVYPRKTFQSSNLLLLWIRQILVRTFQTWQNLSNHSSSPWDQIIADLSLAGMDLVSIFNQRNMLDINPVHHIFFIKGCETNLYTFIYWIFSECLQICFRTLY